MSNCPDWLKPFQRETEALAAQNAAFREETERMRRENVGNKRALQALRELNRNPDKDKQIFESSITKSTTAPLDNPRRTGRTTRLLKEAYRLASNGRAVYVLACRHDYALKMECDFDDMYGKEESIRLGIKFESPSGLPNFDFRTMTLGGGAHPNCCVLVDHYTIELHYARLLQELHRFDEPTDTN
jgi:hypothetical protein